MYHIPVKDPSCGYYGTHLWVPKKFIQEHQLKCALEFEIRGKDGNPDLLKLYKDTPHHLAIPRSFFTIDAHQDLGFPIHKLQEPRFPRFDFSSYIELDKKDPHQTIQRDSFEALIHGTDGILNLACGFGKTCVALHTISHLKLAALIIVNQTILLDQWSKRICELLKVPGKVGIIQGKPETWDWKHPITLASIHTLAKYPEAVTPAMRGWFGVVVWDECHHLSAPVFSVTATLFYSRRIGLTATVKREDGTHVVYEYHIGPVLHKHLKQTVHPTIKFVGLHYPIPSEDFAIAVLDRRGTPNIGKLRTYVADMNPRNYVQLAALKRLIDSGRKVLALSHSKAHLNNLYQAALADGIDCGLCTGDQKVVERWEALKQRRLILGIHQMVMEAIDEESLDTLVWLMPFGTPYHPDGGRNALQQGMGRIQGYRFHKGMKHPLVIIFDDTYISMFHRMCLQLRKQLNRWPEDEGGPYRHETVEVYNG